MLGGAACSPLKTVTADGRRGRPASFFCSPVIATARVPCQSYIPEFGPLLGFNAFGCRGNGLSVTEFRCGRPVVQGGLAGGNYAKHWLVPCPGFLAMAQCQPCPKRQWKGNDRRDYLEGARCAGRHGAPAEPSAYCCCGVTDQQIDHESTPQAAQQYRAQILPVSQRPRRQMLASEDVV